MGFFDGAVVEGIGGARIYLAISSNHYFHIKLGCGGSTNTKAKLLAMWALLHWASSLGLPSLQIFGDASIIINWALGKASLSCLSLDYWCVAIRHMMPLFLRLDMLHIYREHN